MIETETQSSGVIHTKAVEDPVDGHPEVESPPVDASGSQPSSPDNSKEEQLAQAPSGPDPLRRKPGRPRKDQSAVTVPVESPPVDSSEPSPSSPPNGKGNRRRHTGLQKGAGRLSGIPRKDLDLPGVGPEQVRMVRVKDLVVDAGTDVRGSLDPKTVEKYQERIRDHGAVDAFRDPIRVWEAPERGLVLACGFHRRRAALLELGDGAELPARIFRGGLRDAIIDSMRDNLTHGLPLTDEQRKANVIRLLEDKQWSKLTDEKMANLIGESIHFIRRKRRDWEKAIEATGKPVEPRKVEVTRDGVTYETVATSGRRHKFPPSPDEVPSPEPAQAAAPDAVPGPEPVVTSDFDTEAGERQAAPVLRSVDEHVGHDGGITAGEKEERSRRDYLEMLPVRKQLHPDRFPGFDAAALAFRRYDPRRMAEIGFIEAGIDPDRGPDIYSRFILSYLKKPGPLGGLARGSKDRMQPGWLACAACRDENHLSTGLIDGQPCGSCGGHAFHIPGVTVHETVDS